MDATLSALRAGIDDGGEWLAAQAVSVMRSGGRRAWLRFELRGGRNRQIRRMCYKLGHEVIFLKRIRIANILLGDLQPGETQPMQQEELDVLFKMAGLEKRLI